MAPLASDGSLCARSIPPLARESLLCALGGEVKMLLSVFLQLSNHWFPFWGFNWEAPGHEGGCMGSREWPLPARKNIALVAHDRLTFTPNKSGFGSSWLLAKPLSEPNPPLPWSC